MYQDFCDLFRFNPALAGRVGVEREAFLFDETKHPTPASRAVITQLTTGCARWFKPELSACQVEGITPPLFLSQLHEFLRIQDEVLIQATNRLGLTVGYVPVVGETMPVDVYPDPRYESIAASIGREQLLAGCRVAGVHVHVGQHDPVSALKNYNRAVGFVDELCATCSSERLSIYKQMAPHWRPRPFASWAEFYNDALHHRYDTDPRSNWAVIRLTIHGTIEFRMFDTTEDEALIVDYATKCVEVAS